MPKRTALVGVLALLALAASAAPASADNIAAKRAQVNQLERELNAFDVKLEAAVQAYDHAQQNLADVRLQIARNTQALRIARRNLAVARRNLAAFLVSTYKGGTQDPAVYVLGSGSFTDLVDRVEYVQRIGQTESELLHEVTVSEQAITRHQQALKRDEASAKRYVAQAAGHRAQVESMIHQRQAMLDNAKADIRRMLRQRELRRQQLLAAQAAAQQQEQQPPPVVTGGDGGSNGGPAPPPPGTLGEQAVAIAKQFLGVPYVWGGASPSGFDCSGLTMYVYAQLGISLPHYTGSQWVAGPHVPRDQLAPGDLVFFYPDLGHVGMYIGGGLFIHAPHTGDVVRISSLYDAWYSAVYMGAVRVTG